MPPQPTDSARAETAVVLQFLGLSTPITTTALYAAIREPGITPADIDAAVVALTKATVIHHDAEGHLRTSAALAKIDELGLIGV